MRIPQHVVCVDAIPGMGHVLVLPDEPETRTRDGVHIPDSGAEPVRSGTIVALGNQVAAGLDLGSRVLWAGSVPSAFTFDGVEHFLLSAPPDGVGSDVSIVLHDTVKVRPAFFPVEAWCQKCQRMTSHITARPIERTEPLGPLALGERFGECLSCAHVVRSSEVRATDAARRRFEGGVRASG